MTEDAVDAYVDALGVVGSLEVSLTFQNCRKRDYQPLHARFAKGWPRPTL